MIVTDEEHDFRIQCSFEGSYKRVAWLQIL